MRKSFGVYRELSIVTVNSPNRHLESNDTRPLLSAKPEATDCEFDMLAHRSVCLQEGEEVCPGHSKGRTCRGAC
jgi:hypothetical protein